MGRPGNEGPVWADRISAAGWRQCSVFRPPPDQMHLMPERCQLNEGEWLVICSQSCTVCSSNFAAEPRVEFVVGVPLPRYKDTHAAAMGKVTHTFHLPLDGLSGAEALECHLGRRDYIAREILMSWSPEATFVNKQALDSFKGWLAHYFMRVALPDTLVQRLRALGGIRDQVMSALQCDLGDRKAEEGVTSFYIRWSTDEELAPHDLYAVSLIVACRDEEAREFMDRALASLTGTAGSPLSVQGILIEELLIDTTDAITLEHLAEYARFNEWDDLSAMPERLGSMQSR